MWTYRETMRTSTNWGGIGKTPAVWRCDTWMAGTLSSLLEPLPRLSPELTRLLTSNDVPLDSEIPVIRQIIRDVEARLLALDAHNVHLPTSMAETEQYLISHRAMLSAVRRVPAELICEIFDFATAQSRAEPFVAPHWHLGAISQ
ncbi:hypothetical protein C8R45DRAFT_940962 [Mycena sanguinolenta]|nr:hypothetical protein C8R45DRAFT_940962 [Mycena sanguinolenta]